MNYLNLVIEKIFHKTATNKEQEVFLEHACEVIDRSWDAWKERNDKLSDEEEQQHFMIRMKQHGFTGNTNEEAMVFLDSIYPGNVRRENLEKRKLRKSN